MQALLTFGLANVVLIPVPALLIYLLSKAYHRPALLHLLWVLVLLKLITPPLFTPTIPGPVAMPSEGWGMSLLGVVWIIGSIAFYLWSAWYLFRFRRLLRFATLAPMPMQEQITKLAERSGLKHCPQVWLVAGPVSPMLWNGLFSTRILFPKQLLDRLSLEEIDTLLAHELAHLRRRDHWVRWLELLVMGLYWWCPLVWWARRQLHYYEEECCDAWVVAHGEPRDYARAILTTIELLADGQLLLPSTVSGLGRVELLKRRLMTIMGAPAPRRISVVGWVMVSGLALALPILPGFTSAPPGAMPPVTATFVVHREPSQVVPGRPATGPMRPDQYVYVLLMPEGKILVMRREDVARGEPDWRDNITLLAVQQPDWVALQPPFTLEAGADWRRFMARIHSLAYSPNGKQLALALADGKVILMDSQGEPMHVMHEHTGMVTSVSFSPDGKTLATGSTDKTVKLWDAATGTLKATLTGHTRWIYAVQFAPQGDLLATAGYDKVIRLWNSKTGKEVAILQGHSSAVRSLAFSPDGTMLASGGADGTVILRNPKTGEKQMQRAHQSTVRALAFSPDGRWLGSASEDGTALLRDARSGEVKHVLTGGNATVSTLAFVANGRILLTGDREGRIKAWSTATGKLQSTFEGGTDPLSAVVVAPSGKHVLTASESGLVKHWKMRSELMILRPATVPNDLLRSLKQPASGGR